MKPAKTARPLDAFDLWMVRSNLSYVPEEGLDVVVTRLRANGYFSVADAVALAGANMTRPLDARAIASGHYLIDLGGES